MVCEKAFETPGGVEAFLTFYGVLVLEGNLLYQINGLVRHSI